jgi:hypothetical protein
VIAMRAPSELRNFGTGFEPEVKIYAVCDHRRDGRPRIVSTYVDPEVAIQAADLLRAVGADVRVELLSAIDDEAEQCGQG